MAFSILFSLFLAALSIPLALSGEIIAAFVMFLVGGSIAAIILLDSLR